jgi:hypothetical protein
MCNVSSVLSVRDIFSTFHTAYKILVFLIAFIFTLCFFRLFFGIFKCLKCVFLCGAKCTKKLPKLKNNKSNEKITRLGNQEKIELKDIKVESGIRKYSDKTKIFASTLKNKKNKNDIGKINSVNITKNLYIENIECKKEPSDTRFFI